MDEFMGIVKLFAGNFAPRGWLMCNGQLLPISQYTALFSLLGTTYGGNGQTTFALPNLQGNVAIGTDSAGKYPLGSMAGSPTVTLNTAQLPAHNHTPTFNYSSANSTLSKPTATSVPSCPGAMSGRDFVPSLGYNDATPDLRLTGAVTNAVVGQNSPVGIMQPYLAMNYIICVEGLYPSRP